MTKKRTLTGLGIAAGLVAGSGAGFVMEMAGNAGASPAAVSAVGTPTDDTTATDGTTATDDTTATGEATGTDDTAAIDAGTDRAADRAAKLLEILQPLIDDGTITQAQADAVIAKLADAGPLGGPGHRGGVHRGFRIGLSLGVVASTLGITAEEVRTALADGQTIAELAVSSGKTAQDVIDAMVAEVKSHLDAEVSEGDLTQAEADTRLAEQTTRITELVNNTPPVPARGFGGRGPRGDKPAPAPEASTDTADTSTADTSGS